MCISRPSHRAKSVGDMLESRSLSDYPREYDHEIPGNVRRPKSLYEAPPPHVTSAPLVYSGDYFGDYRL